MTDIRKNIRVNLYTALGFIVVALVIAAVDPDGGALETIGRLAALGGPMNLYAAFQLWLNEPQVDDLKYRLEHANRAVVYLASRLGKSERFDKDV